MGNAILIGVCIFLLAATLVGYSNGCIKMVFSLVSVIVILGLVTVLTPIVKDMVKGSEIEKSVNKSVEKYVDSTLLDAIDNSTLANIGEKKQKIAINQLPLPESIKNEMIKNNNEEGYVNFSVDNFADYVVAYISDTVIQTGIFLGLIVVISILVNIAIGLLNVFAKLPVISTFNKGGGAIIGFVEGLMFVWILCIIITAFSTTSWGQKLFAEINNNVLLDMIYSNNYLEKIIGSFF